MKSFALLLFSALVLGSVASATVAPLPQSDVGTGKTIYVGGAINSAANGGGVFGGTVNGHSTAFWCIDDQTFFSPGQTAYGNITKLSFADSAAVAESWYGSAGPTFSTLDVGLGGSNGDLQQRLLMAAYLITQYGGYNTPFTGITGNPLNEPGKTNDGLQNAIWALLNNTAFNGHSNGVSGYSDPNLTLGEDSFWLNKAKLHFLADINPNEWAVVTWGTNGVRSDDSVALQTFMVKLTPEPGFYGTLALGMSGLVFAISRRRKSS